jgi:hypothetical protein
MPKIEKTMLEKDPSKAESGTHEPNTSGQRQEDNTQSLDNHSLGKSSTRYCLVEVRLKELIAYGLCAFKGYRRLLQSCIFFPHPSACPLLDYSFFLLPPPYLYVQDLSTLLTKLKDFGSRERSQQSIITCAWQVLHY